MILLIYRISTVLQKTTLRGRGQRHWAGKSPRLLGDPITESLRSQGTVRSHWEHRQGLLCQSQAESYKRGLPWSVSARCQHTHRTTDDSASSRPWLSCPWGPAHVGNKEAMGTLSRDTIKGGTHRRQLWGWTGCRQATSTENGALSQRRLRTGSP